jgi:1,2-diacylglycerol-3-alpha-glucose alpha-1,2-glucosyltransferase
MRVLVYFQPNEKLDVFEGMRLRKNIKGALELSGVNWVESIFALPDIVHFVSPDDENKAHDAALDGEKVVVSALYSENDPSARYLERDSKGDFVLRSKAIRMLSFSDLILVPSPSARDFLRANGIVGRTEILPAGVNLSRFEKNDPVEVGVFYRYFSFKENEKFVLVVGDYDDPLCVERFLRIASLVPEVRFVFLGMAAHGRVSARRVRSLGKRAPANVRFSDLVQDDVYRSAMMNATIYLSFESSHPDFLTVLEAMAAKTQVMSLAELKQGNLLIDKENAYCYANEERLAKAIQSYCQGKLNPTIIEAYRTAKAASLRENGAKLKAYYESLLKDVTEDIVP